MLQDSRRGLVVSGALLTGGAVVGLLVALPATRPTVQTVDEAVREAAVDAENRFTTVAAFILSWLGGGTVNWPLRALAILFLAWKRHWIRLAAFVLAVVTSELLIGLVKAAYDRPRPPGSLIETTAASFPSGHAVATAVTAGGLVLVLAPHGPERWRRDTVAGALLGAGLALGWPALLMAVRDRRVTAGRPAADEDPG
jgi:undecaprenyl-diphosphatase